MDEKYYTYNQLSEEAKENAKYNYLNDDFLNDDFYDSVSDSLSGIFPTSDLKVEYSLSSSQGDGLNIYGQLSLKDALFVSTVSDEIKNKIEMHYKDYLTYGNNGYNRYGGLHIDLSENGSRYTYSYKFMDIKNIEDYYDTFYDYCYDPYNYDNEEFDEYFDKLWESSIKPFLINVLEYMESLDKRYEEVGYEYLYEISDEEMEELSDSNNWLYDEDGNLV